MAKLVVINQGLAGLSLELSENWATIGRGNGNALQIVETSVSSKHCEVQLKDNELRVRDLRSTNGTFVRGQKVSEAVLKPGQTLRLGQIELRFEAEGPAPVLPKKQTTTPARPPAPVIPSIYNTPAIPVVAPAAKTVAPAPAHAVLPTVAPAPAPVAMAVPDEAHATSPVVAPAKPEAIVPSGKRFHILFVDDNETFLTMFTELCGTMANKQWETHIASTADRALDVLRRQAMDLVVLDIGMPLVDGIQLLSIIKRRYHDLKVAVLTANATDANRTTCLAGGAEIFIEKPTVADGFKVVFNMLNDLVSWTQHREGFSGTVRQVGLQEVIQMECLGRHSSVLEIRNQNTNGQIFIESGSLVHAETATLSGEKALQLLLSLSGGEFRLLQFKTPKDRTINGSWEFLLMEAARLRDEESHKAEAEKQGLPVDATKHEAADPSKPIHIPDMIRRESPAEAAKHAEAPEAAKHDADAEFAKQFATAETPEQAHAAELLKQAHAAELARQVEAEEQAKQAELAKQAEDAELVKLQAYAAEQIKQAEAAEAVEATKRAQAEELARQQAEELAKIPVPPVVIPPPPAPKTVTSPPAPKYNSAPASMPVAIPASKPICDTTRLSDSSSGGTKSGSDTAKLSDSSSTMAKSAESYRGGESRREGTGDPNVHSLGEDIVIVATYDGKWHPSVTQKK